MKPVKLLTWIELNHALKTCTEDEALVLLLAEQHGKRRAEYMRRIYATVNRLRSAREKGDLAIDPIPEKEI